MERVASHLLVGALRRRIEAAGGFATVIARGDDTAGAILLIAHENGRRPRALERQSDWAGGYRMITAGPIATDRIEEVEAYAAGRRRSDPDLWVIEANIADAERFAAETIAMT